MSVRSRTGVLGKGTARVPPAPVIPPPGTCVQPGNAQGEVLFWDAASQCYVPTSPPADGDIFVYDAVSGLVVPRTQSPLANGSPLVWGATVIPNLASPSYLRIGGPSAAAGTIVFEIAFPWPGIVDSLLVIQNATSINLDIPYTLYVNGAATPLTVTHNANSLGPTSDLVNAVIVAANDRLALRAQDSTLSTGTINLVATARFLRT